MPVALETISAFRRVDVRCATAGQPDEIQLAALAGAGFEVVVNLGLHDDPRYSLKDEAATVAGLGMAYFHRPVSFQNPTPEDLEWFFEVMHRMAGRKVLVHCAVNKRVSVFWGLYRVLVHGETPETALTTAREVWEPDPVWSAFLGRMLAAPRMAAPMGSISAPVEGRLVDRFRRHLCYLRVSITDRCNLGCVYCVPASGRILRLSHHDILRYEEILRIIRLAVKLGVTKVRITGGEPLVRRGVGHFLREVGRIPGIRDLSLTTNGVLLEPHLEDIRRAGIRRLNISLDTLRPDTYRRITGHDGFAATWSGIMAAHEAGFSPIKINAVAMRGVNDDEVADLAGLSRKWPFHVRFIEYMPIGDACLDRERRILAPELMERISAIGELLPVKNGRDDGPAERYRFRDAPGEVGFIRPLSRHFCASCTRLRLTAAGMLRSCLLSDAEEDLRTPLRQGRLDEDLIAVFDRAVRRKPAGHELAEERPVHSVMSGIGG